MNAEYDTRLEFKKLNRSQQILIVANMRRDGFSEGTISHVTGVAIEQIREILHTRECESCQ